MQTNCVDNGPRQGLETFLQAASDDPETVLHYEFMQVSYLLCLLICRCFPGVSVVGCHLQPSSDAFQSNMQDYRVHIKHTDGRFEYIPYFSLPAGMLLYRQYYNYCECHRLRKVPDRLSCHL